jgi:general secretion pathway protein B
MSYILEALKKAQAERQLGCVPTIDAAPVYNSAAPAPRNKLLWLALLALVVLALALLVGLLLWRQMQMAVPPAVVQASEPVILASAPVVQSDSPVAKANPPPAVSKAAQKVAEAPKAAPVAQAPAPAPRQVTTAKPQPKPQPQPQPQPQPKPQPQPQPPAPLAAPEPAVPALRELPEPIQRQIPAIAIGGYIYSKNPADRLLLIDKSLRSEGDELAPGLVLEKLQPAAAIFNFRGYRYRVPY